MQPDYQFDFFRPVEKKKWAKDMMLTAGCIGIFMSSLILPVAYFSNYKNKTVTQTRMVPAVVMSCSGQSDIVCSTDTTFFEFKI